MPDAVLLSALVDGVIVVTAAELVVLAAWRRRTGRGLAIADTLANAGAGLCLLGALRGVLAGAEAWACAAWLIGAGLSHAADLRCRWRSCAGGLPASSPHHRRLP